MAISFKNVGIRRDKLLNDNSAKNNATILPIGIKTPMAIGNRDNEFLKMHYDLPSQVRDNLRNLVLTNHGERLIQYNFGANLYALLFEYTNKESFDDDAMLNINTAVAKYMPYVNLADYESDVALEDGMSKIKLTISYSVPLLNVLQEKLEVVLITK